MKKRLTASVTCLCLLLTMLLGSTVAWFTDDAFSINTMIVGNVEIKQYETDRDGIFFKQNQKMMPAVIKAANGIVGKDSRTGLWYDEDINNEIDKIVTIKNTGSDPAFVRTVFAFEMMYVDGKWENPLIAKDGKPAEVVLNFNTKTEDVEFEIYNHIIYRHVVRQGSKATYYYSKNLNDTGAVDAAFIIGAAVYPKALASGQTSPQSLRQFYLAPEVGNAFYQAVNYQYEILVLSQAVQQQGFEEFGAKLALDQSFGEINAANAADWFGKGVVEGIYATNGLPSEVVNNDVRAYDIPMYDVSTGAKVASIVVPTSALKDGNVGNFYATIDETTYAGNITVEAGEEKRTFDIAVRGLVAGNETMVKVELFMGKDMDPATFQLFHYDAEITDFTYNPHDGYLTFETNSFSPFTVVYDAESRYVPTTPDQGGNEGGNEGGTTPDQGGTEGGNEGGTTPDQGGTEGTEPGEGTNPSDLPVANVVNSPEYENVELDWGEYSGWSPTEGLEAFLEAAYTFTCVDTDEEAKASKYANWYCDFVVVLDKDLPENSLFLGGNYGAFGWVGFHNGDMTLEAGTEVPLLGSVTSNPWTYADVASFVGTFICGVGDVDDALKDATFTVMLRLTNPDNEEEFYNVATIQHTFTATTEVSSADELSAALANGGTIKLTADISSATGFVVPKDKTVVLNLNGRKISGTAVAGENLIVNNGKLSVVGKGEISVTFTGNEDNSKAVNAIANRGTLIVNGGKISNTGSGSQIGYAIDNYNGATLMVNAGKIVASGSSYYDAIRLFCGSNETLVTVNGGEISSIWAQNPSASKASPVKGTVVVNGGTIGTVYYENYTTVMVKSGVTVTVTPYGAGERADAVVENDYTVYAFKN